MKRWSSLAEVAKAEAWNIKAALRISINQGQRDCDP